MHTKNAHQNVREDVRQVFREFHIARYILPKQKRYSRPFPGAAVFRDGRL
jgi:hypothetical protein